MNRRKEVVVNMYEEEMTEELIELILLKAFEIELAVLCDGFYVDHPDSRSFEATKVVGDDFLKFIVDYENVAVFVNGEKKKVYNIREFDLNLIVNKKYEIKLNGND